MAEPFLRLRVEFAILSTKGFLKSRDACGTWRYTVSMAIGGTQVS